MRFRRGHSVSDLAPGGFPAGATAALLNLVVTQTQAGGGYLNVYATGQAQSTISAINYYTSGQTIATTTVTGVSNTGSISVTAHGAATQFVVGVVGYYP